MTNPQDKHAAKETMTKNVEEVPDDHRKTVESYDHSIPFPRRLKKEKEKEQFRKFFENLQQLSINILIVEALEQMPKYDKFIKDLLCRIGKAEETSKITLNKRCSAVLLNKIPLKERDIGSFTILCVIGKMGIDKALADLGANINLMPYSMYARLDLGELKPTFMCIELANKSTQYPKGIVENVIVKIDKFIFPVDFVVLDMKEYQKILIILRRPFFATAHAIIDVFNKKISFEVGNKTIAFDIEKSMNFFTPEDDICLSIDMVDESVLDHGDEDDDLDDSNESGLSFDHEPNDFRPTLFAANTSEVGAQLPKLKELPSHLEYAFLNNNKKIPGYYLISINSSRKRVTSEGFDKAQGCVSLESSRYQRHQPIILHSQNFDGR
ncbi:putative nucleotidyltransferase, ribonuclease H [Tanacetum coccineum]